MKYNAHQPKTPKPKKGSESNNNDDFRSLSLPELQEKLGTSPDGLSQTEAQHRLIQYGPNEIGEKKINPFLKLP